MLNNRLLASVILSGVMAFGVAACGDDESSDTGETGETSETSDTGADATPVEVTHALGVTEVPADPQRIVALGPAELDAALALDAPVVGTASNGTEAGLSPWTAGDDGAADLTVLTVAGDALTVDLEEVAALDPDLILAATYYDIDNSYDLLSEIAPTVAYQEGPVTDTWQQVTLQVGTALGRDDDAAALVAEVEQSLADAAIEHPQLDGATYTFAFAQADSVSVLRDPDDVMMLIPSALGLTMSPAVLELPEGDSFAATISFEQLDALEADVLALFDGGDAEVRSALEASPLYATLDVVARDAVVTYDYDEFIAMRQPTAGSIPWVVEHIVPRLAEAVASDI